MNIVFFGSFQHYSAQILQSLIDSSLDRQIDVIGVVTTPPAAVGRKQILTKSPVHLLAEKHHIPVFTPSSLTRDRGNQLDFQRADMSSDSADDASTAKLLVSEVFKNIPKPDFFLTTGYGKILPQSWLDYPKLGSLNLHFSLLPKYRGANPAEWAIMCGETKTGITLIQMNQKLDGGDILAQAEIPILETDTRETLYQKLYQLGADMLPDWLVRCRDMFLATQISEGTRVEPKIYPEPKKQPIESPTPYAALLKRPDGFLPWSILQESLHSSVTIGEVGSHNLRTALTHILNKPEDNQVFQRADMSSDSADDASTAKTLIIKDFINRLPRALAGFPSLWTIVPTTKGDKRMKILSFEPYLVQLEGQSPALFNQIKNQIRLNS